MGEDLSDPRSRLNSRDRTNSNSRMPHKAKVEQAEDEQRLHPRHHSLRLTRPLQIFQAFLLRAICTH